jgi:MFS transporter, DHA2 family, methylenomycin A resistance protein
VPAEATSRGTVPTSNAAPADNTPIAAVEPSQARITLLLASLGFFLITLDILIVNVALAQISRELGGGTVGQQWVVDGYTVLFASLLLFAGNFADRIGAKRAFSIGVALFGLTSAGCALAPTIGSLIAARAGQGAAAAMMLPASMALIREAFPHPGCRARALGVWAVGGAIAAAVGPLLGGVLTTVDWRLVFGINIPVCALMLMLLTRVATSPKRATPFDWAGQVQVGGALAIAIFGALIADRDRFLAGMQVSLTIAASLLLITALVSLGIRPSRGSAT